MITAWQAAFVLLVLIVAFFAIIEAAGKPIKKSIFVVLAGFAVTIAGLREEIGTDYLVYLRFFQGYTPVSVSEPGFLFFATTVSAIDPTGHLGIFLSALVIVTGYLLYFYSVSQSTRYLLFVMFLCIPFFYISSFNLVRQHISIAIFLAIYTHLDARTHRPYKLAYFILPPLFHYSSLFLIISAIFVKITLPYAMRPLVLLLSIPLIPFILGVEEILVSNSEYSYYTSHQSQNSSFLFWCFLMVVLCAHVALRTQTSEKLKTIVPLSLGAVFFVLIWQFSNLANFWLRVAQVFLPFTAVTVSKAVEITHPKEFQFLLKCIIVILLTIYATYKIFTFSI